MSGGGITTDFDRLSTGFQRCEWPSQKSQRPTTTTTTRKGKKFGDKKTNSRARSLRKQDKSNVRMQWQWCRLLCYMEAADIFTARCIDRSYRLSELYHLGMVSINLLTHLIVDKTK